MAATLIAAIAAAAARAPDTPFSITSEVRPCETRLSAVIAAGQAMGTRLAERGLAPGAVVGLMLPNWREWLVSAIACVHAGMVLLPIVSIYGARELSFILRQSRAQALITPAEWRGVDYRRRLADCGELADLRFHLTVEDDLAALEAPCELAPPVDRDPEALSLLIYTSGTTADPKGVMHSDRTILAELAAQRAARMIGGGADVILSPWPPGHIAGALSMLRHAVHAVPFVGMDQWDPTIAAELMERHRVTSTSGTPFHLQGMLDAAERDGRDLSALRNYMVGAAPVPSSLVERCLARGLAVYHSYGSSEHPTVTSGSAEDPLDKQLGTEGRAMAGSEVSIVDDEGREVPQGEEGEVATRGAERFIGYFDPALNAAAFTPDGWYRTGDIGRLDAEGYLVITDRKKDIIIRGGENIASKEVENVLLSHPAVADVAVVAAPDPKMGEAVRACVVLRPDATLTLDDVRAHFAAAGIARQKTPERLSIVAELPRNASGKVLKHVLRASA